MRILSNHQLNKEQLAAHQMVEKILNTTDFEAWFVRARFTEMNKNLTNIGILENCFRQQQYRYEWKVVPRPWYKALSKELGTREANSLKTYKQKFDVMNTADRAAYLTHELMHMMGFEHSEKPSVSRNKSLPYQVADYVYKAVSHYLKANE
jgi:hypothetical protein